ncbi:hypothetical protein MC885_006793, partial [Smutsia gigantea]
MRKTCGDVLDDLPGDCHQVLVEDCIPVLKRFAKQRTEREDSTGEFSQADSSPGNESTETGWEIHHTGELHRFDQALSLYEEQLGRLYCPEEFSQEI